MTDNEKFFIESSSSGFDKENVNHSLDDTLKLLHIKKNKKGSIINVICKKYQCHLQEISIWDSSNQTGPDPDEGELIQVWKMEACRACAPTSWEMRSNWNPLFEILATIYQGLLQQRHLDIQITNNEVFGLADSGSVSVVNHFSQ
ncbi:hypothetical protein V8B55DRAFT_1413928 [Mucor lusitanicus]